MKTQSESVLVVDDDSEVLTALDAELSDYFDVTALLSAEQALATLQVQAFSAIISDVRMPGIDGLTLIKECAIRYPEMVRLILTAFDDEEVQETALGEYGAYKLIKPWGDDLIVTLQNALKQRKSTIELQKSIDLGSVAVELDLRLHLNLKPSNILETVVSEILRVPEVMCVNLITYSDGTPYETLFGSNQNENIPRLTKKRLSSPEEDGNFFKYAVPIGVWPNPVAVCVCRLSRVKDESIRYLDFIGRQAYRTILIVAPEVAKKELGRYTLASKQSSSVPSPFSNHSDHWVANELIMPTTVIVSATECLREHAETQSPELSSELLEIASDLDIAYANLVSLLENLKKTAN